MVVHQGRMTFLHKLTLLDGRWLCKAAHFKTWLKF